MGATHAGKYGYDAKMVASRDDISLIYGLPQSRVNKMVEQGRLNTEGDNIVVDEAFKAQIGPSYELAGTSPKGKLLPRQSNKEISREQLIQTALGRTVVEWKAHATLRRIDGILVPVVEEGDSVIMTTRQLPPCPALMVYLDRTKHTEGAEAVGLADLRASVMDKLSKDGNYTPGRAY